MQCAKCRYDNPGSARFCNQCGGALIAQQPPPGPPSRAHSSPAPHPALAALLNLVLFWRPVEDGRTADRLRNVGFVGAIALFVQSLRDVAFESAPHWTILFVLAAVAATVFLYQRWVWAAALIAIAVFVLTLIDAQVSSVEGYSTSVLGVAARILAALLLANGARGLRFGAPSAGLASAVQQVRAFFGQAAPAQQARPFFTQGSPAPALTRPMLGRGMDILLVAFWLQIAGEAAILVDAQYWASASDVFFAMALSSVGALANVIFCSPVAACVALGVSIAMIANAGELSAGFLVLWLIYLAGAALGLTVTARRFFAPRPS